MGGVSNIVSFKMAVSSEPRFPEGKQHGCDARKAMMCIVSVQVKKLITIEQREGLKLTQNRHFLNGHN